MEDLIKISSDAIDANDVYDFLEVKHKFSDWIRSANRNFGFKEGVDFSTYQTKSEGGRPFKKYALSIHMAKELLMVSKTPNGKMARNYFNSCGEIVEKAHGLLDRLNEVGDNYKINGGYKKLAYELIDVKYKDIDNFRDTLNPEQLKNVKTVETMIGSMLELGKEYGEIKDSLSPIFKELSEGNENE